MKTANQTRTLCTLCALLLCLCALLALPALATTAHAELTGQLDISYTYTDDLGETHTFTNAEFHLYEVADLNDDGTLTNTDTFESVSIADNLFYDQDLLIETRDTLEHYININALAPDYTVVTDNSGEVTIDLPSGLYYIDAELFWDSTHSDEIVSAYYSSPFLVLIGAYDPETNTYLYDYTAIPKVSVMSLASNGISFTYDITVQKEWENTEYTTLPESVEVVLYSEGTCTDKTATLSAANNWSYTWTDLSAECVWSVCEVSTLEDYTTRYETTAVSDGFVYTVTNTYTGGLDPTPTPAPTTPPTTTEYKKPRVPPTELAQTGSSLPYVPIFAGLGALFIVVGVLLKKSGDASCE